MGKVIYESLEDVIKDIESYDEVLKVSKIDEREVRDREGNIIRKDYVLSVNYISNEILTQESFVVSDIEGKFYLTRKLGFMTDNNECCSMRITDEEIENALRDGGIRFIDYIIDRRIERDMRAVYELTVYIDDTSVYKKKYVIIKSKDEIAVRELK